MSKQRDLLQKSITTIVIVLLISITFTPFISAKGETQVYTLLTPSIFGLKKQQINLTSEQSEKLEYIFDDLQEQLKTVGSIEETKILFKRTIGTLVDNGLLSKSDAYITKKLLFSSIVDRFYSFISKILNVETDFNKINCWIIGETTSSVFFHPILRRIFRLPINWILPIAGLTYFRFFADISFGSRIVLDMEETNYWSKGWIWTNNKFGNNSMNGTFRGGLSMIKKSWLYDEYFFLGVYFFLGIGYIKVRNYFLGLALLVDIYEKQNNL
ncbi:MAG: hypothetical protein JSU91_04750 [Thermoplasmatales archaeon]|nr:MAG: hypothetical protein JSU91_04750 [Thermoplasmatales archaeon]